jgi:hypothetical protein
VDETHHLIVAEEVTQEANDSQLLIPMASAAREALGVPQLKAVADTGYYGHDKILQCSEQGIEVYVPMSKRPPAGDGLYPIESFSYDAERDLYVCPQGRELTRHSDTSRSSGTYRTYYAGVAACRECPMRQHCTQGRFRKLNVHASQELIDAHHARMRQQPEIQRKRGTLVEHVFGTLKFWLGYRSFLTRGLEMVRAEFSLSCLAYNFRRVLNVVTVSELLAALQKPALAA